MVLIDVELILCITFSDFISTACGDGYVALTSQGSVNLTVPMVATYTSPFYDQQCGYTIAAPANHRVYLVIQKINLVSGSQTLVLSFGIGKILEYKASVEQPLDIVSTGQSISISLSGTDWNAVTGISFQFSATQQTDYDVCDNGVQVLPADKKCDQRHDCVDYSDEFNCGKFMCGNRHTNLTLWTVSRCPELPTLPDSAESSLKINQSFLVQKNKFENLPDYGNLFPVC